MKQILIEKYIEPSEVKINEDWVHESWLDKYGDTHSILGQPSLICYNSGKLCYQEWYKKGIEHRNGDLPSFISYDSNGQISCQAWYKNGELIKKR
jgi:antitoxin component YwqK of YwqJK toxin-antitoxin module